MKVNLHKIIKKFSDRIVLNIDNLTFEHGKFYAILGPNGSGKTTLLRLLAGIDKPNFGEILYNCRNMLYNNAVIIPRSEISYMPQKPYMFDMTVLNNLLVVKGRSQNSLKEAEEALNHVDMMRFKNARVNSLSGGEVQRIALARTLILNKSLVLLDEPASAADVSSTRMLEDYIKFCGNNSSSTIIFTTHNPYQAIRIADELIFLWNGKVIESGTPQMIIDSPQSDEVKNFLQNWRF